MGVDNVVRPNLPVGWVPVSAQVVKGKGSVISPTELRFTPGDNTLRFVARPPAGGLQVEAVALYGGERIPLKGVPFTLAGKSYAVPITLPLTPGSYAVTPSDLPGSQVNQPAAGVVTDGNTGKVAIEYVPRTEVSLLTTPDTLAPCDIAQLTATAKTDFPYPLPSDLSLNLPSGWTADATQSQRGDLSASSPLSLKLPVKVCRSDTAEAVLKQPGLRATGQATVLGLGSNVSRSMQQGARASVSKAVSVAQQGYTVTLHLTVDSALDNLSIIDPLPESDGPLVRGNLKAEGPSLADLNPQVTERSIVLPRVIPGSYTLTYTLNTHLKPEQVLTAPELRW